MQSKLKPNWLPSLPQSLGEFFGTLFLVFIGKGAIMVNAGLASPTDFTVPLAFGAVVGLLIIAYGDASGAHFNPAVTLGFSLSGRFSWSLLPSYWILQLSGGIAGAGLAELMFASFGPTIGATDFTVSWEMGFLIEAFYTFFLMTVIFRVSSGPKEKGLFAALAVGLVIFLGAYITGPLTGGSFNPARSLGPALFEPKTLAPLWIYFLAPFSGAALAAVIELAFYKHSKSLETLDNT
jgi:aquaporin NIP